MEEVVRSVWVWGGGGRRLVFVGGGMSGWIGGGEGLVGETVGCGGGDDAGIPACVGGLRLLFGMVSGCFWLRSRGAPGGGGVLGGMVLKLG